MAFMAGFKRDKDSDTPTNTGASSGFQAGWDLAGQKAQAGRSKKAISRASKSSGLETTPVVTALIPSFKHGGRVKKTGLVYVHRGERIIPAKHGRRKAFVKHTVIKP